MAVQKQFNHVAFSRIKDLLGLPLPKRMSEIGYIANCTAFRRLLLNKYGIPDLDIDHEIATNPDTKLTYLGYKRFLESDLKHILQIGADKSAHSYKQDCKYLAKQLLIRGDVNCMPIKSILANTDVVSSTGLCADDQTRFPQPSAALHPRITKRYQIVDSFVEYLDWIHYAVALQCRPVGQWGVG